MDCIATRLPYRQAGILSAIAADYIDQSDQLKPFFAHALSLQGIQEAIKARQGFKTNRADLVQQIKKQYDGIETSDKVKKNIESLLASETFTVTTAHQNNIFTGPLYFLYKIIHAIKLADHFNETLKGQHFVPVFYIGSEDADIDELNHVHITGEKLTWHTTQKGAVGRMKIDKALIQLIDKMEGQLSVFPDGKTIITSLRTFYAEGATIQDATFQFVNHLFAEYGLIVLLPDNAALKKQLLPIFEDDLLQQKASDIVESTAAKLAAAGYKVQANPREINLFYLKDDIRERIEVRQDQYAVLNTGISFTKEQLLNELQEHPDRFSPNVILRGLYQETILPDIAFVGGGGEVAYWLQLKDLFEHYKVPYPVLILRNSFLLIEKKWQERIAKLDLVPEDFFLAENEIVTKLVKRDSKQNVTLNGTYLSAENLYDLIKEKASAVDVTLSQHVEALKKQSVKRLKELEKKMLRAEKKKFAAQQRQIHTIKEHLFPKNGLQERIDNFAPYYAVWGMGFMQQLYNQSLVLEQEFVILTEK